MTWLALLLTSAIAGMLYHKIKVRPRRVRISFYVGVIQLGLGSLSALATSLAPISPISCVIGGIGVYINPIITLIDVVMLLSVIPTKLRANDRLQILIYVAFIVARIALHIMAGAVHYWAFSFCTI